MTKYANTLVLITVLSALTIGCARDDKISENTINVSYTFLSIEGDVITGSEVLGLEQNDLEGAMEQLIADLDQESGELTIRMEFEEGLKSEIECTVVDGMTEGVMRMFSFFEGMRFLSLEQSVLHDKKHGKSVAYFPDARPNYEGQWDYGLKVGFWTFYFPNGQPAVLANFEADQFHGETIVYDDQGNKICVGQFAKGIPADGTFLENPWGISEAIAYRLTEIETKVERYENGQLVSSTPITIRIPGPSGKEFEAGLNALSL